MGSYYQNNNRGRALEADPDRLQYDFVQINPNRPPHVPPIQPPIRDLNGWIPYIAGRCAEHVQGQAEANNLRVYMFNLCAYNNFANEFFDSVVLSAVDLAGWLIDTQRYNVQEAVEIACEDMVDMTVAANCRDYPDLWNYVDRSQVAAIEETIGKFDQVGRDIGAWKNPRGQQRGGTYQAPNQGRSRSASYAGGVTSERSGGGSSYSARTPSRAEAQRGGGQQGQRRNSWGDGSHRNRGQQQQEVETVEVREEQPVMKEIPASIANWRASREYPYFLAYDLTTQIATLEPKGNNTLEPIVTAKSKEDMDYAAHATPNAFGKPPAFLDLSQSARTIENVRAGMKKINAQSEMPPAEEGKPSLRTAICDTWVVETSESAAWLMANLERQHHDTSEDRAHVYRVYGTIADGVLTIDDENAYIEQFAAGKGGFLGLKGLMETLGANVSLEVLSVINKRMTALINRKLHLELGLKTTISNFREDIEQVIKIVDERYGFKAQFLQNQQADIARTIRPLSRDMYVKLVANLIHGMDFNGATPNIAMMSSNYSLTFLDCNIWDITVQMGEDGVPARVTKELTPDFYELVKGAFDDADNYRLEGSSETSISRVLFRTLDGTVMEATKGALVEGAYMLTHLG
jgi:hypothetical protein